MAEHAVQAVDPFADRHGPIARLAAWIGCTEGQVHSMVAGIVLVVAVSVNALPHVGWETPDGIPFASPPIGAGAVSPDAPQQAADAGLIAAAPELLPALPPRRFSAPTFGDTHVAAPAGSAPTPEGRALPDDPPPTGSPDDPSLNPDVVRGGYASAAAGTPLATVGVPEGSVAAARRAGHVDKVAYLELDGSTGRLELDVDADGVNVAAELAGLRLCRVTAVQWDVGAGDVAPADAPEYDCAASVAGERNDAGDRWAFDLDGLDLADATGVAIVPDADAVAPEFQVVFRLTTTPDAGGSSR